MHMQKFYLFILLLTSFLAKADIFDDISSGIRTGNARQLASFLNTSVDLTILDREELYSKAQAELILKDFFSKNAPREFTLKHQGTSREGAKYGIGAYVTAQGKTYRTYFLLRQTGGRFLIQELRFESERNTDK
jgi:hypothetical protein